MSSNMNSEKDSGAPWHRNGFNLSQVIQIFDGPDAAGRSYLDGRHQVVVANFTTKEQAEEAVRARNAHDDLVAALISTRRVAATHMKARGFSSEDIEQSFPQCDAALAKAGGANG